MYAANSAAGSVTRATPLLHNISHLSGAQVVGVQHADMWVRQGSTRLADGHHRPVSSMFF